MFGNGERQQRWTLEHGYTISSPTLKNENKGQWMFHVRCSRYLAVLSTILPPRHVTSHEAMLFMKYEYYGKCKGSFKDSQRKCN